MRRNAAMMPWVRLTAVGAVPANARDSVDQPQRRFQRPALRRRKVCHARQERADELVHAGEAEFHLGLDTDHPDHPEILGLGHCVLDQRTLADSGFTPQDQRGAETAPHRFEQAGQFLLLPLATGEHVTALYRRLATRPGPQVPCAVRTAHPGQGWVRPGSR
jgi:hypothetical protein